MEQLASDTRTNRSVTCILNRIGWRQAWVGVCGGGGGGGGGVSLCIRPQPWRSFMFTLFCICLKSKACNESKDVNMDILLLANWQNYPLGKHVVCNYWWYIHSLLWFIQPAGRGDCMKLLDILILIVTGNADSPGRLWCGGGRIRE